MMAPTELLAEQHYLSISEMLKGSSVKVELLTGSLSDRERSSVYTRLASGDIDILVGTHALLTEGVRFESLAVAVIDEQHRFGVHQRAALRSKGGESGLGSRVSGFGLMPPSEGEHLTPALAFHPQTRNPRPETRLSSRCPPRDRHDRHADSADVGADAAGRPGHFGDRRTAAGPDADRDTCGRSITLRRGVRVRAQAAGWGRAGIRGRADDRRGCFDGRPGRR